MTELGELQDDPRIANAVANFRAKLLNVESSIVTAVEFKEKMYDRITTEEKVQLDTYLAFATNSLYFMCVKLRGEDTKNHDITNELSRVRHVMERAKQIHDSKTLRPRLDKGAAGRFIKHSIPKHRRFQENASDDDEMEQKTTEQPRLGEEQEPALVEIPKESEQSSKFITASSKLVAAGGESSCDDGDDDNEANFIGDT